MSTEKRNTEMGILTGIAIILVVLGHLDMNELSVFGLFPYYSFHVMVFLFISGYFYDPANEERIPGYIGHKTLRLLVPYYICNVIYGIISTILSSQGFAFCTPISFKTLVIEPFLGGHQYGLNFPAWFVPALFIIEVLNILGRKVLALIRLNDETLGCIHADRDILVFICTLAAGMACVYLAQGGHVWGAYKTPGRILFMLPVYELGRLYRTRLEEKEKRIPDVLCISLICIVQFIIYICAHGMLNFSAVWVTSFASFCFVPYLTVITGTWFWLRISRIISDTSAGRGLDRIGMNSFSIMMHHVAIFFAINLVTYAICIRLPENGGFDVAEFHSNVNYAYQLGGMYAWKCIYLIAGILIPVLISGSRRYLFQLLPKPSHHRRQY